MNDYYDTGVLLKLVIQEPESPAVITFIQTRAAPLPLHPLLEYEAKNALRAKRFRKEITARELRESLREIEEYIRLGRFERITLDLLKALDAAEGLSAKITPATGCRAIDLLHISIARQLSCRNFVSLDVRQLKERRKRLDSGSLIPVSHERNEFFKHRLRRAISRISPAERRPDYKSCSAHLLRVRCRADADLDARVIRRFRRWHKSISEPPGLPARRVSKDRHAARFKVEMARTPGNQSSTT